MSAPSSRRSVRTALVILALAMGALPVLDGALVARVVTAAVPPDHLVISEVVTGGASASDEFVEIYNPTDTALPLEGLELVYVSASGATVTRRASWSAGAPLVPPRSHLLLANDLGVYAPVGDALVTGGMAATGGSVALRILGATSAIDAVGWGTAANAWTEGDAATAPGPGESLERLPGGSAGSAADSDDNATDFVVRAVPDPQNLGSPPTPDASGPTPPPSGGPPTPEPTGLASPPGTPDPPTPVPTPGLAIVSIASARALPDGTRVTVEGVSLAASDFTDGGGYLADATGGIAVIPDGAGFERGRFLRVTGELDDRFGQRTIRVGAGGITDLGAGSEPPPTVSTTGGIGEVREGSLVRIAGTIDGTGSSLTTGTAFDVDDGSGPTRLVVAFATGIDVTTWRSGTVVDLVGVAGQRDSSGTGAAGYRVQPRDPADVVAVTAPASPTPSATPSQPGASGEPSPSPGSGVVSIAEARLAETGSRLVVRGTVTLPSGILDRETAVIQDASGAIMLRLGSSAGSLRLGDLVEAAGTRSTKSGMETIRVTDRPRRLGSAPMPAATTVRTDGAAETVEARLVVVRGAIVAAARRSSSGTVTFDIDDGSGPLRVAAGAPLDVNRSALIAGAWVEVRGVLGQVTTGSAPESGYRVWPRAASEIRLLASPTAPGGGDSGDGAGDGGSGGGSGSSAPGLGEIDEAAAQGVPVGATLVVGSWPEVGIGGLLWDGERVVAVVRADGERLSATLGSARPPQPLELRGLAAAGTMSRLRVPLVTLGTSTDAVLIGTGIPAPPATSLPRSGAAPRWVSLVGRLTGDREPTLVTPDRTVRIDVRCDDATRRPRGLVAVVGLATSARAMTVPCGGMRSVPILASAVGDGGKAPGTASAATAPTATSAIREASPVAPIAAAALLGAAALSLAGAAAWMRLRPEPDPDPSAAAEEPLDEPGGDLGAQPAAPPVLTLVRLPHERGP